MDRCALVNKEQNIEMHSESGRYEQIGSNESFVNRDFDLAASLACEEDQDGLGNAMTNRDGTLTRRVNNVVTPCKIKTHVPFFFFRLAAHLTTMC